MTTTLKFISCTVALDCNGHDVVGRSVRINFYEDGESIRLQASSGKSGADVKGRRIISREQFENRPGGDIPLARWALSHCGWSLMIDDYNDAEAQRRYNA